MSPAPVSPCPCVPCPCVPCLCVPCLFVSCSADGDLLYQQVPLVEIDGMKLIQTKAILQYIAEKYNLHGKDLKDKVMYDPLIP